MRFTVHCFLNNFLYTNDNDTLRKKTIPNFLGAFPAAILPYKDQNSCCCIWNTDDSSKPSQHWIAIKIIGKNLLFFDSFGFPMQKYQKQWKTFTDKFNVTTVCKKTI